MAINYELINKGGISLGTNFELLSEKPLDSRLVVPSLDGLQNYIDSAAAYEGMIAYVSSEKKHYEVKVIDGVLSYRPFGLTETELNDIITNATTAAMEFKGATATLPESPAKGDMYKVAGENIDITIDGVAAKLGDSIVYNGTKWFLIPSGDDLDTWRPVDGVSNEATLKFVNGDKTIAAVATDGTIKYNHAPVAAPKDTTAPEDRVDEDGKPIRTYITAVETDDYGHITGYKTATENVYDTNTEYTFESQVESSSVYFNVTSSEEGATEQTIYVDAYSKNEADGKFVAKEAGKSLVSDDEITRLAKVDNYEDKEVRGLIDNNAKAIEEIEKYVGTIPSDEAYKDIADVIGYVNKKAEETLAAASGNSTETAASVKQQLDNYKSENNTRVEAIEDDVAAIKNAETGILKQAQNYADGLAGNYDEAGAAAGVQTALEAEIAKKVDKESYEDDKATFATKTELGDVDKKFADYKTAADQKVIDDAQDVEIAKKVDKVTGKSLVDDAEITKLAGVSEGANKVEASTNGKIKIDGVDTTVYVHPDKHTVSEISDFETKIASYDYATNTEAQGYADAKDEAIEAAQKAADDLAAYVGTFTASEGVDTVVKYIDAKTANIASDERVNGIDGRLTQAEKDIDALETESAKHAVKTDVDAALLLKADKSVVDAMYTNGQIDTAVQGAKDYAKGLVDAIPAQTDYSVTITENTDDNTVAKTYVFSQCGAEIGSIKLAKELVVTSGSVKEVATEDTPYAGAKVGDKYIELVIANQDAPIYVPAKDLVDIYTAKDMTGIEGAEVQVAISNTNEISATLVNGGITEEKLAKGVKTKLNKTWEEVGVAAGLVEGLENGQVKANKEAIEKLNGADTVDGSVAKSIKDAIEGENLGQYAKTADLGNLAALDTITADKVTDFATEVAKVKVNEAVKADEATKAAQDGNGKVIADTYAEKATTLAGYGIGDAYTKTEIEALLTWGSF